MNSLYIVSERVCCDFVLDFAGVANTDLELTNEVLSSPCLCTVYYGTYGYSLPWIIFCNLIFGSFLSVDIVIWSV
jgi:hypothetical protein